MSRLIHAHFEVQRRYIETNFCLILDFSGQKACQYHQAVQRGAHKYRVLGVLYYTGCLGWGWCVLVAGGMIFRRLI
jgi:hypothetical protein